MPHDSESTVLESISSHHPPPLTHPLAVPPNFYTSKQWLKVNGLKATELTIYQVRQSIRTVVISTEDGCSFIPPPPPPPNPSQALAELAYTCSKPGLYLGEDFSSLVAVPWNDGTTRTVHIDPAQLVLYRKNLLRQMKLFNGRARWLGTGVRRVFGNVVEKVVTLVIDISSAMRPHMDLLRKHMQALFEKQLKFATHFNIVVYDHGASRWQPDMGLLRGGGSGGGGRESSQSIFFLAVPVTERSLRKAWKWVDELKASKQPGRNMLGALKLAANGWLAGAALDIVDDARTHYPLHPKGLRPQTLGDHGIYLLSAGPPDQRTEQITEFVNEVLCGSSTKV